MNSLLANIYGTGGFEKTASTKEQGYPDTLYDLALLIAVDKVGGDDLEKTASVQETYFSDILAFDRAGRALAHQEFAELEKRAYAGDDSALREFFGVEESENEVSDIKQAIIEELNSRLS